MVLEAFACTAFSLTEFTKTQHYSLEENTKEKILTEGLYHFTSKDVAKKIVSDGYFRPTKGFLQNHLGKDKVYMFAGIPDMENFSKNLPANLNPFVTGNLEFSAVKLNPNSQEISNFKERLQDSAVVYEGRYDIGENRAKAIDLVIDLDKDGKCIFREKTEQELENGYVPSKELLDYVEAHKISKSANNLKVLYQEVKAGLTSIPNMLPRVYRDFKDNRQRKKEIREFEPYEFELGTLDENVENKYSVSCEKLEFYGDKKLNKLKIDKQIGDTGENVSYECYVDGHVLNLGDEAAALYLKNIESAIENRLLNKVNDVFYAGQPMYDIETGNVSIGVDAKFNELLKERNMAEFFGHKNQNSDELFNKKVEEYYKRHPIKKFINERKIKKGEVKMLLDKNEIGKYTNEKLASFSIKDEYNDIEEHNGFELNKRCDFEYKGGSKYSVLIGDTVELDGKRLTKLIVGEENYLSQKLDDTVKLPQNYYIDAADFEKIDKKDLAKYISNLGYQSSDSKVQIEQDGFVGKYIGGLECNKRGKISSTTYDQTIFEKYGNNVHIKKGKEELDMSNLVCNENELADNYSKANESIEKNKEMEIGEI